MSVSILHSVDRTDGAIKGTSGWMKVAALAAVSAVLAASLAACGSSGSSRPGSSGGTITSVPIGVISELSGQSASSGLDTLRGAQLAVQIINDGSPGISPFATAKGLPNLGGAAIKLYPMDTQGSPQTSAAEVNQLVSADHVAAIEGSYSSADTAAASAVANRQGVPFVNAVSSAVSLTQRGLKWFFRVGPTDLTFAQQMFALIKQDGGNSIHTIAILHTNDTYGDGVEQVTKQLAASDGYGVVADIGYDATSTTDLTPQVTAIRAAHPDVVFDSSYTTDAVLLMQTMNRLNYSPKMLLGYGAGFSDPTFLPTLKSLAKGVMSRAAWSEEIPNKASQAVAAMFQKEYGRPMTENSARSFTATMTLAIAINNARSDSPDAILSALESINIPGKDLIVPWAGVRFDADHQNVEATGIVQQVQGNRYNVVFPAPYAVAKPVLPLSVARQTAF